MSTYHIPANSLTQIGGVTWTNSTGDTVPGGSLNDGDDTSYIAMVAPGPANAGDVFLGGPNIVLPSNEHPVSVVAKARVKVGTDAFLKLAPMCETVTSPPTLLNLHTTGTNPLVQGNTFNTFVNLTSAPYTATWTGTLLNQLGVWVYATSGNVVTAPGGATQFHRAFVIEASVELTTTSIPTAPTINALGTVTDTLRPTISWQQTDRKEYAVGAKQIASNRYVVAIGPTAGLPIVVGQTVHVSVGDSLYDGAHTITAIGPNSVQWTAPTQADGPSQPVTNGKIWFGDDKAPDFSKVYVYNSTQYSAGGFNPTVTASVYQTTITGSTTSLTLPADLPNDAYRVYVSTGVNTLDGATLTTALSHMDWVQSVTDVSLQGNLLTANESSMETSTAGWSVVSGCTLALDTTAALLGSKSLKMTATATSMAARVARFVPVEAGTQYSLTAWAEANTASGTLLTELEWYDSTNTLLSTSVSGTPLVDSSAGFLQSQVVDVAPLNAVSCRPVLSWTGVASGNAHRIDSVQLRLSVAPAGVTVIGHMLPPGEVIGAANTDVPPPMLGTGTFLIPGTSASAQAGDDFYAPVQLIGPAGSGSVSITAGTIQQFEKTPFGASSSVWLSHYDSSGTPGYLTLTPAVSYSNVTVMVYDGVTIDAADMRTTGGIEIAYLTNVSRTSNVVTLTAANHPFVAGDTATVVSSDPTWNGSFLVQAATATTFSFNLTGANVAATALTGIAYVGSGVIVGGNPASGARTGFTGAIGPIEVTNNTRIQLANVGGWTGSVAFTYSFTPAPTDISLDVVGGAVVSTPAALPVALANAAFGEHVVFTITGQTKTYTALADAQGILNITSVPLPLLSPGTYSLTAVGATSGRTGVAQFQVLGGATRPSTPAADVPPVTPATQVGIQRWVFQDPISSGLSDYVFPINPLRVSDPFPPKYVTPDHTTAPDGQFILWEGGPRALEWKFSGKTLTQDFHDNLLGYAGLNRRIYVIDHNLVAYAVVITNITMTPADAGTAVNHYWVHDYEVTCQLFKVVQL